MLVFGLLSFHHISDLQPSMEWMLNTGRNALKPVLLHVVPSERSVPFQNSNPDKSVIAIQGRSTSDFGLSTSDFGLPTS